MATWYIVDGSLPYLEEFPTMQEIDDAPLNVWRITNGNLPFKLSFPQMPAIDDAPSSIWRIIDGELPYKTTFPAMYKVTLCSIYNGDDLIKNMYVGDEKIVFRSNE